MVTELQLTANRRNSQKSTGPRSEAGKAVSSQNSLKTGIYSEAEIIRDESRADLDALAADYHHHFQPAGPVERCLVDILIHSEWMLRRFRRAEAQLWEINIDDNGDPDDPENSPLGWGIDVDDSRVFARLQRRIDSTQRNYQRALKDLKQLQAERPTPDPLPEKIEPASATDPIPAIGFVPSTVQETDEIVPRRAPLSITHNQLLAPRGQSRPSPSSQSRSASHQHSSVSIPGQSVSMFIPSSGRGEEPNMVK